MFNNHLMKACLAAVFAIGLAACSSSSDNGGSASNGDQMPAPSGPTVADLQAQIDALRAQLGITDDADIGDSITALMDERDRLQKQVDDAADDEAEAMREAMVAAAAKLYAGISVPTATDADTADTDATTGTRFAQHAAADGANAGDIEVAISNADNVFLSEDEDATVADNAGWEGKRYTRTMPVADGTYEAVVYSNVEAPTMGRKFGSAEPGTGENRSYEYTLANGILTNDNAGGVGGAAGFVASRVALSGVTRTAGTETFNLPDPNTGGATIIAGITGSYHGVSGSYSCTPTTPADGCSASVAEMGLTLAGGAWTFRPSNAEARVMSGMDTSYASYGWWVHRAANDGDVTASAFVDELGDGSPAATGVTALNGTATYTGGAAGHYALRSSTGGTNDSGQFTADATLEANFNTEMVTGTIDGFMGADGEQRNWSVELTESGVGDGGVILGADGTGTPMMTVWTIDGTDGDAAGQWQGSLRYNGDDGVPQVATGTFYSTFGEAGRMVGAFGANLQQ